MLVIDSNALKRLSWNVQKEWQVLQEPLAYEQLEEQESNHDQLMIPQIPIFVWETNWYTPL